MQEHAFLIGNDINNISNGVSWQDFLQTLMKHYNVNGEIKLDYKPFPLLYEEIFLKSLKKSQIKEFSFKTFIAEHAKQIQANPIHDLIRRKSPSHIITTNYEYLLEGPERSSEGNGLINERLYSIFRKCTLNNINYWHIHGECDHPKSINLGYEHYSGQLQQMRNYVVTGTNYKSSKIPKTGLYQRLRDNQQPKNHSWIDLFFTHDIYIFGLGLEFSEIDLWWLLTFRARKLFYNKRRFIKNRLIYFVPQKYLTLSRHKLDLLEVNGVEIVVMENFRSKEEYYSQVLKRIPNNN